MDRNEVVLVGRLSAAVVEHSLPSGDTVTKWRIIVRRRRHRPGGTLTDSIPCATFNRDTAAIVRSLKSRDYLEVTGTFRCRVFGPPGAKTWRYEVEVDTARPVEPELPGPVVPEPIAPERALAEPDNPAETLAALVPRQAATCLAKAG
ncbi:single-stranded DNA-binding protein [Nonomuraea sp. K274]|uniref:Single-stranded DNA-binding protein n=1 Tax=Nonomuraea cypriaca TaxID=1187855 RepID=A0A931AGQ2_9ACTN|nr:single-stranded DNA-binding protein [Nonomuraea cypriaca]MBF8192657.1 single-stranded DNA-binding protein [Nonomuraea cypriaca]